MAGFAIRIDVTPESTSMFDLGENKRVNGVISGYYARFFTENPPPMATELVTGKLWIGVAPDFNAVKQQAADSAGEVKQ